MKRWQLAYATILAAFATGVVTMEARRDRPALDPAGVNGAAVDVCFDCKDMFCDHCPKPMQCREISGYCQQNVRNLSQFCAPRINGQWEECKWRVDPAGTCVTQLLNPCTPEKPACTTPISGCGPMGICIPEGVCIP